MARLLLSFVFAMVAYELYWHLLSRWQGVRPSWFSRSRAEQCLRQGVLGFVRLVIAWTLVLTVYTFGTESLLQPFTARWWLGSIGWGECAFNLALAPILAAAELYIRRPLPWSSRGEGSETRNTSLVFPLVRPEPH